MKKTLLLGALALAAAGCFDNRGLPPEVPTVTSLTALAATNRAEVGRLLLRGSRERIPSGALANLPALQTLDLSEMNLKDVPPEVATIASLREFYFVRNKLTFFPKELAALHNLVYLNLDGNAIAKLPEKATDWPLALKWLRLNDNPIAEVPGVLAQLKSLKRFYLRNAKLKAVPEVVKEWPALEDLVLDGNAAIREVPAFLLQMPTLKAISFSGCGIAKLPADLTGWKKLEQLNLAGCPLSDEETKRVRAALPDVAIVF